MGESAQTFLEPERFVQAFFVQHPSFLVGLLHGLPPRDPLLQLAIGSGECLRTNSQVSFQLDKVCLRSPRRAPMLLDRCIGFGEEDPGSLGVAGFRASQISRQQEGDQSSFVNPSEIECLQTDGNGLAAQAQRWFQAGVTVSAQVLAQRGQIAFGEPERG